MSRKHLSLVIGAWIVVLASAGPVAAATNAPARAPLPATLLPYLQNPAPDAMTVCFLAQKADAVSVTVHLTTTTSNEFSPVGFGIPGTPWTVWKARLTHLQPGGSYAYQVKYRVNGEAGQTASYAFRTPDPQARSVAFAEVNDIHNNVEMLTALMRWVKPEDYEFFVLLGDWWTNPEAKDGADKIFRSLQDYVRLCHGSEKPMLFVRGNHETIGDFADKMAYLFDQPGLDPLAKLGDQNWYYTFSAGPVWLLALDGGDDFTKRMEVFQPIRQRQADWMRELLAAHAGTNAAWRILLTHQPLYNDTWFSSEPCRQLWEPVLANAGIDLEISGHQHCLGKLIEKGKTYTVEFKGHYPDQQDPQGRKSYTVTPPFPGILGGGPKQDVDYYGKVPVDGVVKLVTADPNTLRVRLVAAKDGRLVTEFKAQRGKE